MPTKRQAKKEMTEQRMWVDWQWLRYYEGILENLELGLKGIERYIELRLKYEPGK
jgi:hypothetical protein